MIIRRLMIRNFGKIHNKTMDLTPGINVLYGENESGKTTVHQFIKCMLYGITRQRGKASRNDVYATYEPWENPADYGGTMWFECRNEDFRLTRNFYKEKPYSELLSEDSGAITDAEKGSLDLVLGDVSEAVYDNTVSVGQLKSVTGLDLVRELQNYMASYQGTGDSSIDLSRARQMLKITRKGYQVQEDRNRKELQKEQDKISANMEYVGREIKELREQQEEKSGHTEEDRKREESEQAVLEQIGAISRHARICSIFYTILFAVCLALALFVFKEFNLRAAVAGGGILSLLILALRFQMLKKQKQKLRKIRKRLKRRKAESDRQTDALSSEIAEKKKNYGNLKAEYQEYEEKKYARSPAETEIEALNLAMETIEELSGRMVEKVGASLRLRTSEILSEITGGKYEEVLMDEQLHMSVNTEERVIPLERLSRGTLEQIYFALRMAAGELFCGTEPFPVILDDVFGMYDEERLLGVLGWLSREKRQVIISTCSKREMELLDKAEIPYRKLLLQVEE